ncbi:O-antigen ligase family protein [Neptuniibacter marinus]|uniref:O-antigen ligase family protein n=1 Tax=Neptuniibacter marinus TaxID=1806670 RepID=UPI003B58BE29
MNNTPQNTLIGFNTERASDFIITACLFIFLILSVSFHGSYKFSGILILFSYILFTLPTIRKSLYLNRSHIIFIVGCMLYIASMLSELLIHKEEFREFDPASKVFLFAPFLFLLCRLESKQLIIPIGFAIGSIVLFLIAFYERNIMDIPRSGGGINPIQFGNTASVMGLISFFLIKSLTNEKKKALIFLLIIGGISGLSASFLSLSRGGWIIIPIGIFLLGFQYKDSIIKYPKKTLIALIITFITVTTIISQTNITPRIEMISTDIHKFSQGDNSTSTGQRLAMWKVAFEIFISSPIVGVGKSVYLHTQQQKADNGEIAIQLKKYNHAHNAYFDTAARRGIIGLVGLLSLLFTPFLIAWRNLNSTNTRIKAYAYSLVILSLSFSSYNLTQSMFNHNSGIIMFTMFMIILISGLNAEKSVSCSQS